MSKWNEESIKKKNYRRGGQEPDPPKKSRHKRHKKPYKLEYYHGDYTEGFMYRFYRPGWHRWGRYHTIADAEKALTAKLRNCNPYNHERIYKKWRIVDTRTSEVIIEEEVHRPEPQ